MRTRHTHSWWISLGELGTRGEGAGSGEGRHKYQRERWSRYLRGVDGKKGEGVKWGVKHSGHVSHWYTLNRASNRWLTYIIIVIDSWSRCALPPPPPTRTPLRGGRLALASQRCWVEGEGIVERGRQKQNTSPVATAPVGRGEGWPAQKAMTNSLKGSGVAQKRAAFTLPRFPDFQFGRTGGGGVNPTGTDRANNTPTIPSFLPSPWLLLVDGPRRALDDDSTGLIAWLDDVAFFRHCRGERVYLWVDERIVRLKFSFRVSFDRIFLWEKSMITVAVNFIVDHFYRSELVRKKARLKRNLSNTYRLVYFEENFFERDFLS